MEQAIKSEMSGDLKDGMMAIGKIHYSYKLDQFSGDLI